MSFIGNISATLASAPHVVNILNGLRANVFAGTSSVTQGRKFGSSLLCNTKKAGPHHTNII